MSGLNRMISMLRYVLPTTESVLPRNIMKKNIQYLSTAATARRIIRAPASAWQRQKKSIQLMGGRIRVESEPGKGSVFKSKHSVSDANISLRRKQKMIKPASILLVEDNPMDVELILDAFKEARLGNKIRVAANGAEALDFLFGKGEYADRKQYPLPDIILLDLKMPGIDGHEVLKKVKGADRLKRLPVIILTSSREEGDRAVSYDNGANSYLVKPVSFDNFLNVVKQVCDYWLMLNVKPPME